MLYYFLLLSQIPPSTLWIYWIYLLNGRQCLGWLSLYVNFVEVEEASFDAHLVEVECRTADCDLQRIFMTRLFFGARTRLLWRTLDGILDEKLRTMSRQWSHWKLLPRSERISVSHHPQFVSIGWDVKREINENFSCDFKFVLNSLKSSRRDSDQRWNVSFRLIDIPLCSHYRLSHSVTPHLLQWFTWRVLLLLSFALRFGDLWWNNENEASAVHATVCLNWN